MRKLYSLILTVFITANMFSQAPQKMSYQAVIRNNSDQLVKTTGVGMQISILQGSSSGTVVYVETQTPTTNANGLVSIEIGSGTVVIGTFASIDWSTGTYFIKTETDPTGGTTYTISGTSQLLSVPYALYAKTAGASDALQSQINMLKNSSAAGGVVSDVDNNIYNVVKIGTQVWMAENLKTTKYNDNSTIPLVTDASAWGALTTPAYCWYNNDAVTYKATYGALYNWYTVNTNKLCPTGWHVPTDAEWTTLTTYLGGVWVAGGKLKETGLTHWIDPNTGATNETGFTALPGGKRDEYGASYYIGGDGFWWSSTEYLTTSADVRTISHNGSSVSYGSGYKQFGWSVRCVRDF